MSKSENIKYIIDFLRKRELFFEAVYDYATFNKEEFHKYTEVIFELSQVDLTDKERYKVAIAIWEVSFLIEGFIGSHYDPEDVFSFKNFEEDDPRQIRNIIHYTANWFSYMKPIEKDHLIIGSWK